jgi:hypothetical protein
MSFTCALVESELHKREQDLILRVKYYTENLDQIIRIKVLEDKLRELEKRAEIECERHKDIILRNQYIINYCEKAFNKYVEQFMKTGMKTSTVDVIIPEPTGIQFVDALYTFSEIDVQHYKVVCFIGTSKVEGVYSCDTGLLISL